MSPPSRNAINIVASKAALPSVSSSTLGAGSAAPQLLQNREAGEPDVPHDPQVMARGLPQFVQNPASGRAAVPQLGHSIDGDEAMDEMREWLSERLPNLEPETTAPSLSEPITECITSESSIFGLILGKTAVQDSGRRASRHSRKSTCLSGFSACRATSGN